MSDRIVIELIKGDNTTDLLEKLEQQLEILSGEIEVPELVKKYSGFIIELSKLRVIDKFLEDTLVESKQYRDDSDPSNTKSFFCGVISGLRKVMLHLHDRCDLNGEYNDRN